MQTGISKSKGKSKNSKHSLRVEYFSDDLFVIVQVCDATGDAISTVARYKRLHLHH